MQGELESVYRVIINLHTGEHESTYGVNMILYTEWTCLYTG
jgi:hypothetical protein